MVLGICQVLKSRDLETRTDAWLPSTKLNLNSSSQLIPNNDFPSDHLAIMAELAVVKSYAPAEWRPSRKGAI